MVYLLAGSYPAKFRFLVGYRIVNMFIGIWYAGKTCYAAILYFLAAAAKALSKSSASYSAVTEVRMDVGVFILFNRAILSASA